jgi:hypothetical protein
MKRYAFVDVENTGTTTEKMLGFITDWAKLGEFMKDTKSCTQVFFYTGIEHGELQKASEFESLSNVPCCVVRTKVTRSYKRRDKVVSFRCTCGLEHSMTVDMGLSYPLIFSTAKMQPLIGISEHRVAHCELGNDGSGPPSGGKGVLPWARRVVRVSVRTPR